MNLPPVRTNVVVPYERFLARRWGRIRTVVPVQPESFILDVEPIVDAQGSLHDVIADSGLAMPAPRPFVPGERLT